MLGFYLFTAGLTLVLELPVYLYFLRGSPPRRVLGAWALGNLITHPAGSFLAPLLIESVGLRLLFVEVGAILVEAAVVWRIVRPEPGYRALPPAAAANLLSYFAGSQLARLALTPGHWPLPLF